MVTTKKSSRQRRKSALRDLREAVRVHPRPITFLTMLQLRSHYGKHARDLVYELLGCKAGSPDFRALLVKRILEENGAGSRSDVVAMATERDYEK